MLDLREKTSDKQFLVLCHQVKANIAFDVGAVKAIYSFQRYKMVISSESDHWCGKK